MLRWLLLATFCVFTWACAPPKALQTEKKDLINTNDDAGITPPSEDDPSSLSKTEEDKEEDTEVTPLDEKVFTENIVSINLSASTEEISLNIDLDNDKNLEFKAHPDDMLDEEGVLLEDQDYQAEILCKDLCQSAAIVLINPEGGEKEIQFKEVKGKAQWYNPPKTDKIPLIYHSAHEIGLRSFYSDGILLNLEISGPGVCVQTDLSSSLLTPCLDNIDSAELNQTVSNQRWLITLHYDLGEGPFVEAQLYVQADGQTFSLPEKKEEQKTQDENEEVDDKEEVDSEPASREKIKMTEPKLTRVPPNLEGCINTNDPLGMKCGLNALASPPVKKKVQVEQAGDQVTRDPWAKEEKEDLPQDERMAQINRQIEENSKKIDGIEPKAEEEESAWDEAKGWLKNKWDNLWN